MVAVLGVVALVADRPGRAVADRRLLFPGRPALSGLTITLLAVGTILAMLVQVVQPALIAVASHRMVAGAWLLGIGLLRRARSCSRSTVIAAATVAQIVAGAVTLAAMVVRAARCACVAGVGGGRDR